MIISILNFRKNKTEILLSALAILCSLFLFLCNQPCAASQDDTQALLNLELDTDRVAPQIEVSDPKLKAANQLANKGIQLYLDHKYVEAASMLKTALTNYGSAKRIGSSDLPLPIITQYYLAQTYIKLGNQQAADELFDKTETMLQDGYFIPPSIIPIEYNLAKYYERRQRYADAQICYLLILSILDHQVTIDTAPFKDAIISRILEIERDIEISPEQRVRVAQLANIARRSNKPLPNSINITDAEWLGHLENLASAIGSYCDRISILKQIVNIGQNHNLTNQAQQHVATSLSKLAAAYLSVDFSQAEKYRLQLLGLYKNSNPMNQPTANDPLLDLAKSYASNQKFDGAESLLMPALGKPPSFLQRDGIRTEGVKIFQQHIEYLRAQKQADLVPEIRQRFAAFIISCETRGIQSTQKLISTSGATNWHVKDSLSSIVHTFVKDSPFLDELGCSSQKKKLGKEIDQLLREVEGAYKIQDTNSFGFVKRDLYEIYAAHIDFLKALNEPEAVKEIKAAQERLK